MSISRWLEDLTEERRTLGLGEMSCTAGWSLLSTRTTRNVAVPRGMGQGLPYSSCHPREWVSAAPPSPSWWDPGLSVPGRHLSGFITQGERVISAFSSAPTPALAAPRHCVHSRWPLMLPPARQRFLRSARPVTDTWHCRMCCRSSDGPCTSPAGVWAALLWKMLCMQRAVPPPRFTARCPAPLTFALLFQNIIINTRSWEALVGLRRWVLTTAEICPSVPGAGV